MSFVTPNFARYWELIDLAGACFVPPPTILLLPPPADCFVTAHEEMMEVIDSV